MPRKFFRKYLPSRESMRQNPFIARFGSSLQHPNLWCLNRRSVAGAVAAGLFAGLVPGSNPVQFTVGALLAIAFRVNLPVAVVVTFYTNPLTIVPLYLLAYQYGKLLVGGDASFAPEPAFDWSDLSRSFEVWLAWLLSLGRPLAAGLLALALTLAAAGYAAVQIGWRAYVIAAWRRRKTRRRA
jgi:uncharacterized protein (DUF2062 family)